MKKEHVPAGSDVSAGIFECTKCREEISTLSITSLPPCARCNNGDWRVISGVGDAKKDPYPNKIR